MKTVSLSPASELRRKVVLGAAGTGVASTAACLGACTASSTDRQLRFGSLAEAADELARLTRTTNLQSGASWSWAQTLNHCAQSIEYSMSGFPQAKPELFQRTLGAAAFSVFSWRGRMTHELSEPIPGAPALDARAEAAPALERLRASMRAFSAWQGPLKPHFAYGDLDKPAYERAHAMHLANHFSAFRGGASNAA